MLTSPANKRPIVLSCQTDRLGSQAQCCAKRDAAAVLAALRQAIADERLDVDVEVSPCLGHCSVGPNLRIVGDSLHHAVTPTDLSAVLDRLRVLAEKAESNPSGPGPANEMLPPV